MIVTKFLQKCFTRTDVHVFYAFKRRYIGQEFTLKHFKCTSKPQLPISNSNSSTITIRRAAIKMRISATLSAFFQGSPLPKPAIKPLIRGRRFKNSAHTSGNYGNGAIPLSGKLSTV